MSTASSVQSEAQVNPDNPKVKIDQFISGEIDWDKWKIDEANDYDDALRSETLCELFKMETFRAINRKPIRDISQMFYHLMNRSTIKSCKPSLMHLTQMMQTQLDSVERDKSDIESNVHSNLCEVLKIYVERSQIDDFIMEYLWKLFDKCLDSKTMKYLTKVWKVIPDEKVFQDLTLNLIRRLSSSWDTESKKKHHVLHKLIKSKREWYANSRTNNGFSMNFFDYYTNLLEKCLDLNLLRKAIIIIEKLYNKTMLKDEQKDQMVSLLQGLIQKFYTEQPDPNEFESLEYPVGWAANWCLENVFNVFKGQKKDLPVKMKVADDLSIVGLCATNNGNQFATVRSAFPVNCFMKPKYFYEVTLLSDGRMRIGWTTRKGRLGVWKAIGRDKHSIGLDVKSGCLWHHSKSPGKEFPIANPDTIDNCKNIVVGCLVDFGQKKFKFYINGTKFETKSSKKIFFSNYQPYFAAASLHPGQKCEFNFGQKDFAYPPNEYESLYEASREADKSCDLMATVEIRGQFAFKQIVKANQIDLFFVDEKRQRESDQLFDDFRRDSTVKLTLVGERSEYKPLRYLQSILECPITSAQLLTMDLFAQKVGQVIESKMHKSYQYKVCELFYPYIQLSGNLIFRIQTKCRTACIVLFYLMKCCPAVIEPIRGEVFEYLCGLVKQSNDEWTKLFSVIAVENLQTSVQEKENLRGVILCVQDLLQPNEIDDPNQMRRLDEAVEWNFYIMKQLIFSVKHLLTKLEAQPKLEIRACALDRAEKSSELKLSVNGLEARSDSLYWQSVRSVISIETKMDRNCFFEVKALTSGPIRIGWTTKEVDLKKHDYSLGTDQFSIAFDGFNRCIWHGDNPLPIDNSNLEESSFKWKAGDVVGCLMKEKQFDFYVNGTLVVYPRERVSFSKSPYHAAISLSAHQQCECNFGQRAFEYAQKVIDYTTFVNINQESQEQNKNRIQKIQINYKSIHASDNAHVSTGNINVQ